MVAVSSREWRSSLLTGRSMVAADEGVETEIKGIASNQTLAKEAAKLSRLTRAS